MQRTGGEDCTTARADGRALGVGALGVGTEAGPKSASQITSATPTTMQASATLKLGQVQLGFSSSPR